jgi:hypothetical protein
MSSISRNTRQASAGADVSSITRNNTRAGEARCEEFLYELKADPAGGRLRRLSSAGSTTGRRIQQGLPLLEAQGWTRVLSAAFLAEPARLGHSSLTGILVLF